MVFKNVKKVSVPKAKVVKKTKKKSSGIEVTPVTVGDIASGPKTVFSTGKKSKKKVAVKAKAAKGEVVKVGGKQEKMFNPGDDFESYEKHIKALLKLRRGLISEVRSVKKDLEWLFLDAVSHFEYKTDLRIKKIEMKRDAEGDLSNVELEIGF